MVMLSRWIGRCLGCDRPYLRWAFTKPAFCSRQCQVAWGKGYWSGYRTAEGRMKYGCPDGRKVSRVR